MLSIRQEAEKTVNVDTSGKCKTIDNFFVNTQNKRRETLVYEG